MVDFISFFHLNGITGLNVGSILLPLGGFIILVIIWIMWKYKVIQKFRAAHLSFFALIPKFGRRWAKEAVIDTKLLAYEKTPYNSSTESPEAIKISFMRFIQDMPIFEVEESFVSRLIRSTLEKGGARFQQVILHDNSDVDDVYVWVQKDGNYFIHDKGVYLFPWKNQKTIQHWDIQDMRPGKRRLKAIKYGIL